MSCTADVHVSLSDGDVGLSGVYLGFATVCAAYIKKSCGTAGRTCIMETVSKRSVPGFRAVHGHHLLGEG